MIGDSIWKTTTVIITDHTVSEVHGTGAGIIVHGTGIHGHTRHGDIADGTTRSICQDGTIHGTTDTPDGMTHGITDGIITIIIADGTEDGILIGDISTTLV